MCFMSTGNSASPVGVNLSQQNLATSFAGSGGSVSGALQSNVDSVAKQLGTNQAQKKAAAKTTSSSTSGSSLLT